MRVLLCSNGPWCSTGYGVQGRSLLPRLGRLAVVGGPENIGVFAWYGLQGGVMELGPHRVYPGLADAYGNDLIGEHARDFGADVVVTLIDVWTQRGTAGKVAPAAWLPWFPVDGRPVAQRVLDSLEGARLALVYSRDGQEQLRRAGVEAVYVPHGVETGVFRRLAAGAVEEFRRGLFGEVEHLAVMVAANKGFPDRKAFQVQMRAWAEFARDKPGARLYLHTDVTPAAGGVDLRELARVVGIEGRVVWPDRYQYYMGYPAEYMALVYNAADVLLAASMGEGFGLPIVEAQACGTPVVVTEWSSMPELVRWGRCVAPADVFWSPVGTWQAWPDVRGVRTALEELYAGEWDDPEEWAEAAAVTSEEMHGEFGWDVVVERHWGPVLTEIQSGYHREHRGHRGIGELDA